MEVKFKVKSPANIALIKYWGRQDEEKVMPANTSFSFNLSECFTITEFSYGIATEDQYLLDGQSNQRALDYIAFVRNYFARKGRMIPFVKVESNNSFEADTGLASSASAFSALAFGLCELARRFANPFLHDELEYLTRMSGSASAVRSLGDFFVAYDPSTAELVEFKDYDLVDVSCVVDSSKKSVSSFDGHLRALTSPLFKERVKNAEDRYGRLLYSLDAHDYEDAFRTIEEETWSFLLNHYSCDEPIQYLHQNSLDLVMKVKQYDVPCAFTFDAGSVVHFICKSGDSSFIESIVKDNCVKYYKNKPCEGTRLAS